MWCIRSLREYRPSIMTKQNKRFIWLIFIFALLAIAWYVYRLLLPAGPILTPVPNHISDKATLSKKQVSVPTNPMKEVFFGDLHVHTRLSLDAYLGGTIASPDDAYQFAKGTPITVMGRTVKIERPIDFVAITDHAESFGEMYSTQTPNAPGHQAMVARVLRAASGDSLKALNLFQRSLKQNATKGRVHQKFFKGYETVKSAWNINLAAAEKHYEPGKFTTLAGYEWTLSSDFAHLHRNVIFRDMKVPDYPLSAIELKTPESLWAYLEKITEEGAQVLAIPHNTNLAKGKMFPDANVDVSAFDKTYLDLQNKFEPLIEIHQVKGNAEVSSQFWKNDEFADFENYNYRFPFENNYVRYGLKKGLEVADKTGINPFKYGIIASTDTHNGTPGNTEESDEYIGNYSLLDMTPQNRVGMDWILQGSLDAKPFKTYEAVNPGGLVAVWAPANTRGHIWDALKNKETYGTSGGRIQVRFFGGFNFANSYTSYEDLVKAGYAQGVPMGGDLKGDKTTKAPSFLIWAGKDGESANLDRIQLIKGWYKNGVLAEQIYNVALSDNRILNADGTVPDNGATVDFKTGAWSTDKGATTLQTVWTDPDFDPSIRAFYYLRVLEIPTARYTLWDEIRYEVKYPEGTAMTIRERAWSSPIWYVPE